MKRLSLATRHQNAHKAQENPHGLLIAMVCILCALFLSAFSAKASTNQFQTIDAYSRACPAAAAKDVNSLANYIYKAARTDLEKARAIYIWLTTNISYDANAYNSGMLGDQEPSTTLLTKRAVCSGFADLFTALGERLGLQIKTITGYSKGYGYTDGEHFKVSDHAWNAINIDGKWKLFDATWGEGYGSTGPYGELVCTKSFNEDWFNVDPEKFVFSHFAENPADNFLEIKFTLMAYEHLPYYTPEQLVRFGHNPYSLMLRTIKGN
ncbi:MAG: transglutaminase domain-containing protein [Flavobacteriales bacterium]